MDKLIDHVPGNIPWDFDVLREAGCNDRDTSSCHDTKKSRKHDPEIGIVVCF
jgi:hypothetical protein